MIDHNHITPTELMETALAAAWNGVGYVSPNPLVGAALCKDGKLIATGFHERFGGPHAERRLLEALPDRVLKGATLAVTLEPCNHQGKTPPCAPFIVAKGIARVLIATLDPNPLVNGGGARYLRDHGVQVDIGAGAAEAIHQNIGFISRFRRERPAITLKLAHTLDGYITPGESSGAITGKQAHEHVHGQRARHDGILVGVGTVLADNPRLNVRYVNGQTPHKFVLDSQLRTPLESRLVQLAETEPLTMITLDSNLQTHKARALQDRGVHLLPVPRADQGLDPGVVLQRLLDRNILSLYVEGGAEVFSSFRSRDLFDYLDLYQAGRITGSGQPFWRDIGSMSLELRNNRMLGNDVYTRWLHPATAIWIEEILRWQQSVSDDLPQ